MISQGDGEPGVKYGLEVTLLFSSHGRTLPSVELNSYVTGLWADVKPRVRSLNSPFTK